MAERGCGFRHHGGLYSVLGGDGMLPLEHFLFDSPIPIPRNAILPRLGVTMFFCDDAGNMHFDAQAEQAAKGGNGCWHIIDVVGISHYPTLPDFLTEGYKNGFSIRLSHTLPLDRLTPWDSNTATGSRHFLVHPKAILGHKGLPPWRFKQEEGIDTVVPCRVQAYIDNKLEYLPTVFDPSHWSAGAYYMPGGEASLDPVHSVQDNCLFDAWLFRDPKSNASGRVKDSKYKPSMKSPYPVPTHSTSFDNITYTMGIFAYYPIQLEMVQNPDLQQDPEWKQKFDKANRAASVSGIKISRSRVDEMVVDVKALTECRNLIYDQTGNGVEFVLADSIKEAKALGKSRLGITGRWPQTLHFFRCDKAISLREAKVEFKRVYAVKGQPAPPRQRQSPSTKSESLPRALVAFPWSRQHYEPEAFSRQRCQSCGRSWP
jgi:hypothetical protein